MRDWTLPDPEARGYGRGAVRVLELAFVRTREVTRRVAANREEKASRAERRRDAQAGKGSDPTGDAGGRPAESPVAPSAPVRREELISPAAERLWGMLHRIHATAARDSPPPPRSHPPPG